jgi:predicted adenylyl cyclase CyaB
MEKEDFKEIEYKYRSDDIKLKDFKELMESLNPINLLEVSSFDHYYTNDKDEFIRYRKSETKPELTIKRKLTDTNNQYRTEVNLNLNKNTEQTVEAFVNLLGYKENFRVFKTCWIYYFDNVDVVMYIVYNSNMKELGRFIEIELLEDKKIEKDKAFEILNEYESKLGKLDITPKNRLKRSLFELFKK